MEFPRILLVPLEERIVEENGAGIRRDEFVRPQQDLPENLSQIDFPSGMRPLGFPLEDAVDDRIVRDIGFQPFIDFFGGALAMQHHRGSCLPVVYRPLLVDQITWVDPPDWLPVNVAHGTFWSRSMDVDVA
jgi:hypothetical protein